MKRESKVGRLMIRSRLGHFYIYRFRCDRLGLLSCALGRDADDPEHPLNGKAAGQIMVEVRRARDAGLVPFLFGQQVGAEEEG